MRLRNLKNKEEILIESKSLILSPEKMKGKWAEHFGNDHPIHLEIGMGKGDFIIENAKRYPDINFIGVEKYDSVIARAVQKLPTDLPNLVLVRANAELVTDFFDREIDLIYLNFSDPWPKKRHAMRRLSSPLFLERYAHIFKDINRIVQKTDNQILFESSLISYVDASYKIEELSLDLHQSEIENNIMTEYEKKFIGQAIYYVSVKK